MMRTKKRDLACYILDAVDKLMKLYPDAGIFICGDFNTLDTGLFNKHLHLNQLITTATRGNNILDKFFTNTKRFYSVPSIIAPVGRSDHNCILIRPASAPRAPVPVKTVGRRRIDRQALTDMTQDLKNVKWHDMYRMDDCCLQADFFYSILTEIIDKHAPQEFVTLKSNDLGSHHILRN